MSTINIQEIPKNQLDQQDKEALRSLLVKSYSQYEAQYKDKDPAFWDHYLEDIRQSVENPHVNVTILARDGEQITGCLMIFVGSDLAYSGSEFDITDPIVRFVAVDPEQRGKRIAQKLMEASIHYTKKLGYEDLILFASEIMTSAIKLYERIGFVREPKIEQLFEGNGGGCYKIKVDSYTP